MAKKENKVFSLIKERYFSLDMDYNKLLLLCKTEEEKSNLKTDYIIVRANYQKSLNLNFEENDPIVKELAVKLNELENRIKKETESLNNVSNALKMISESVKIASTIVVTAMSLM